MSKVKSLSHQERADLLANIRKNIEDGFSAQVQITMEPTALEFLLHECEGLAAWAAEMEEKNEEMVTHFEPLITAAQALKRPDGG